ncbi:hypothetical protein [Pontibacter harenae]|nr:hypothetical protein [Pontibacter harenae]MCC9167197.1 hypothetical protein [Pontibacter harenae]
MFLRSTPTKGADHVPPAHLQHALDTPATVVPLQSSKNKADNCGALPL